MPSEPRTTPALDPYGWAIARLDRALGGPRWMLRATIALVLLSLFLHFPSCQHLRQHLSGEHPEENWTNIERQRDALLSPHAHLEGSRLDKTTFRLTVPAVAKVLQLGPLGIYVLQFLLGLALVWLLLSVAYRHTGDRVTAALFAAMVVCAYAGSAAFFDTWGHLDAFAYFLLALALAARRAPVVFLAVFLAALTDERGLVASAFVLLYHLLEGPGVGHKRRWTMGTAVLAVVGAWAAYFACRAALAQSCGFRTSTAGIGPGTLLEQIDALAWGLWSGLEGGWLVVAAFLVALLMARDVWRTVLYGGALLVLLLVAIMVTDITRSMAYGFVLLFPAMAWLACALPPERLRALLFFAALVSVLHPMYYTFGDGQLYPVDPVFIKALRLFRLAVV